MPTTCFDVANYFFSRLDEDAGDVLSNLKLQKLVYYAQGFALALLDRPLFPEPLIAWQMGPVCPPLFRMYAIDGPRGIPAPPLVDLSIFPAEELEPLDEVWEVYGQFAAWKLRDMVLTEAPWKETAVNDVITHERLKAFFLTRLRT